MWIDVILAKNKCAVKTSVEPFRTRALSPSQRTRVYRGGGVVS